MVTLYRPAGYDITRVSVWSGLSTDDKPLEVENGSQFDEIDTGKTYRFDAENQTWYEGASSE